MKKLLIFLLFSISLSSVSAEIPDYEDLLNTNIKKYGWKLQNSTITTLKEYPIEIHTLTKSGYILKCITIYRPSSQVNYCETP